jgi:hypothetical protein
LKGVFDKCFPAASSGPDIQIFKRFQKQWNSVDKKSYTTMLDEEQPVEGFLENQRVKMITYLQQVLKDANHPREDYAELLRLSLLFVGGWSGPDFKFRTPGAIHQARWMAKAIYVLKIVLFSKQIEITDPDSRVEGNEKGSIFCQSHICTLLERGTCRPMGTKE